MASLQDVIEKNLQISYDDIATSPLTQDRQLCLEIQQILFDHKFYNYTVDGLYGKITREALRDFKEAYALTGGDVLGPTTAEFLSRLGKQKFEDGINDFSTKQGTQRAIIRECKRHGLMLNSQIAYVLATAEHETAHTFKPVREAFWMSEEWRKTHLRYYPYYGRGYVQLTWKFNYQSYSNILGTDLVSNPDRVMEPNVALFILVDGMAKGRFTGKRLGSYINGSKTDFYRARLVVNGFDRAEHIAQLARAWQSRISSIEPFVIQRVPLERISADEELEIQDKSLESEAIEELVFKQIMSS